MRLKKQSVVIYIFATLASISLVCAFALYFTNLSDKTLPRDIEFRIDNPKVQAKINSQIQPIIVRAAQEHKTRTELLNDILKVLSGYDIIDTSAARLGFDGKLIVSAHVQKPVLAVHVKSGDVFIVGSAMKIIEKNPNTLILQSVPNIFFPEMQIKDKKEKNIDFAWFLDQINLINDNFQWYNHAVQKIIWTESIGFTVKLQHLDDSNIETQNDSDLVVYLGHGNIDIKVDKLKIVAQVLKQKNFTPREIDLDSLDRAFIK